MRRLLSAFLALPVVLSVPVHAQVFSASAPTKSLTDLFVFGVSGFGSVPMGEFRQHENGGAGVDVMAGLQPFRREPLVLRGQFAWMRYDGASAYGYQDVCDDQGACWTEEVRYNARNHNMYMLHGGAELMATDGAWRPFGYGLAGWTWFSSSVNLKPQTPTGPDPESLHLFSSRNFSTMYGAGVRRVGTVIGRETGWEVSSRFTRNAKASYLTERGVVRNDDGSYSISPRSGAANTLSIHVGFWIGPRVHSDERRIR